MSDIKKVIDNGYCVGCGACAFVEPKAYIIKFNEYGEKSAYQVSKGKSNGQADKVCPFSSSSKDESKVADENFQKEGFLHDSVIGYHHALYAGHVAEGEFRGKGSSGGMVSWLINELFSLNEIDYVIHVKAGNSKGLFAYSISGSADEARKSTKSQYYPISMEGVLREIKSQKGQYFFVGLPCFIKALKNVALLDERIKQRVKFTAGLVCGHLKSTFFSYNYSIQLGIAPDDLSKIDYRYMENEHDGAANQYFIKATDKDGNVRVKQNIDFYGYLWGHGFFKYKACDYCDDIFSETADICFGDAWVEPYVSDPAGDNIIIVRNKGLERIISSASIEGRLKLDLQNKDNIKKSQEAGIRHRRDGVIARTSFKKMVKKWSPTKRFTSAEYIGRHDLLQKIIYVYREFMSQRSREYFRVALEQGDYKLFRNKMKLVMFVYNKILYFPFKKIKIKLIRLFK